MALTREQIEHGTIRKFFSGKKVVIESTLKSV